MDFVYNSLVRVSPLNKLHQKTVNKECLSLTISLPKVNTESYNVILSILLKVFRENASDHSNESY